LTPQRHNQHRDKPLCVLFAPFAYSAVLNHAARFRRAAETDRPAAPGIRSALPQRQRASGEGSGGYERAADYQSAIWQTTSLRYGAVGVWSPVESCGPFVELCGFRALRICCGFRLSCFGFGGCHLTAGTGCSRPGRGRPEPCFVSTLGGGKNGVAIPCAELR